MATISGTVYNSAGAVQAGRVVRAYRRDTGELIASTQTSAGAPAPFRYVRFRQIATSGYLEISELQLFSGATQRSGAISASTAPLSGAATLASLNDGSVSTRCYWSASTVAASDFAITFDFGSGNAYLIDNFKQGGFDTSGRHIQGAIVESSNDGISWSLLKSVSGLTYPGSYTLSAPIALDVSSLSLGAYQINTGTFAGEVQVICLDDADATLENDLILRTYPA